MSKIDMQECIEKQYSKTFIDGYIRDAIKANPEVQEKINQGVILVNEYMNKTYSYESKNKRVSQLTGLDVNKLVMDIFTGIAYCQKEELFTSITAQLASRLKFSDKGDAIKTIAEITAVLCLTDAFDICKPSKGASLTVISRIPLSDEIKQFIANTAYLPPMVCEPLELENNYSSGYLTHNDSLILGKGNHHDGSICLDVLNKMNRVQLRLDTEFLSKIEEEPTYTLNTQAQKDQWNEYKTQSYKFYSLIAKAGNRFWLTHKVDKRGRIYVSGYHISTQSTAFKKASIELFKEELVTGVP